MNDVTFGRRALRAFIAGLLGAAVLATAAAAIQSKAQEGGSYGLSTPNQTVL